MRTADHDPTTPAPESGALAILHPLTRAEADRLIGIGEALARIDARLAALLDKPAGDVIGHARALAADLIDTLDAADGDPDLEPDADDEEDDPAEDGNDHEPSLGAPACDSRRVSMGPVINDPTSSQRDWGKGPRHDREDEHDGSEPDQDGEPSLASPNVLLGVTIPESRVLWRAEVRDPGVDQREWFSGGDSDREGSDDDREGANDEDLEPDADEADPRENPLRLDVFAEPFTASLGGLAAAVIVGAANE